MKVLLPTSLPLDVTAPTGSDVTFVPYDVENPVPEEHTDAEALVVWGNRRALLADAASRLGSLRWVQALAAGPDVVVAAGFAPDVVITSGRSLHDGPVAEHTLGLVLAAVRRLDLMLDAQREHRWAQELGGVQSSEPSTFPGLGTLDGREVTVWGFGSIGQRLAPLLTALGAHVVGVATTAGERAGHPVITTDELDDRLTTTDVLVCILPATPGTAQALDARRIALLPDHAWVVNVGRGSTVDEVALDRALRDGSIGGAALDVTDREPLPAESPLWTAPRTILTPHAAGGRPQGASRLVDENLTALLAGAPLTNVVER
ncbi:phosphoglycerate dehydrogenase [Sanguibacter suaedae]|uniref:Phosphoglycerate dehydrogenase n=1 Tax=Sanguibacter suaedae TaxID=2795737 RepID=A0A934I786_9MICO|nr:phosphoglycerate dehydrogenase [Sanguibacter suaedae]MBI9114452.1 phosphoglycerate dehydrogenase [Sanguibacter suaedae]